MSKESKQGKGVSDCYVFKSRLQEYAQKVGFSTPVYETIKEGPSHEPFFKSTVIVNNARYDSLPGFSNRKAAEQSAAEVALLELAKCGDRNDSISQPVHEIGLCKNLLQEYAQKMNYAMPTYECKKQDTAGRGHFSCTVEIGSIRYIGAVARTKKEAEIKAARTALLAIQTSSTEMNENPAEETKFTVVPCKRKEPEPVTPKQEAVKTRKPKKNRFKKKPFSKRRQVGDNNRSQAGNATTDLGTEVQSVPSGNGSASLESFLIPDIQMPDSQPISMDETAKNQNGVSNMIQSNGGTSAQQQFVEGDENQVEDVGAASANLSAAVTTAPSGNGSSSILISQCPPVSVDKSHGDASISEGLLIPNVEASDCQRKAVNATLPVDLQASECQPVSVTAIGTFQDGILNTNSSHGDTTDSVQKVDAVKFNQEEDSSKLDSDVCSSGSLIIASSTSTLNETILIQSEPGAQELSMDCKEDNTIETNEG